MEADVFECADHLLLGVGQQIGAGLIDGVEARQYGSRLGRSGGSLGLDRGLDSRSFRSRGFGHSGLRRLVGRSIHRSGGRSGLRSDRLPGVARGLLHLVEPLLHDFRLADGNDALAETVKGHPGQLGGVMLLQHLLVLVMIRRPEQLARDAALVDDREVALGGLDLDILRIKELVEVVLQHVLDSGLLGVERQMVGHRHVHRGQLGRRARGLGCTLGAFRGGRGGRTGTLGRLALDDGDEALVLFQHGLGDFEQLEGAAGSADGLHHRGEAGVLWIARDREIRADIRAALHRRLALTATEVTAVATTAEIAARTTLALIAGTTSKIAALATLVELAAFALERGTLLTGSGRGAGRCSTGSATRCASGLAEAAAVTGLWTSPSGVIAPVAALAAIIAAPLGRRNGFDLGPLGAEGEALQLAEVDFVQTLLVDFVGGRSIVHIGRNKNGRGYPVESVGARLLPPRKSCAKEAGVSLRKKTKASAFRGFTRSSRYP